MNKDTDILIDNLLKKSPLSASHDFADNILANLHIENDNSDSTSTVDRRINAMLAEQKIELDETFTPSVLRKIRRIGVSKYIMSMAVGLSAAACAIIAATSILDNRLSSKFMRPALTDSAQIAEIDNEISDLYSLIAQEEFIEYMNLR